MKGGRNARKGPDNDLNEGGKVEELVKLTEITDKDDVEFRGWKIKTKRGEKQRNGEDKTKGIGFRTRDKKEI